MFLVNYSNQDNLSALNKVFFFLFYYVYLFCFITLLILLYFCFHHFLKIGNTIEAPRQTLKQSQSMMANSFNMIEFLRDTTQVSAANYHSCEQ